MRLGRLVDVAALSALVATALTPAASAAAADTGTGSPGGDQTAAVSCPAVAPVSSPAGTSAPRPRPLAAALAVDGAEVAFTARETPQRMIPGDEYPVQVLVRNVTAEPWPPAVYALSYHWELPDGSDRTAPTNRLETPLPDDLAPGEEAVVQARVKAPQQTGPGTGREAFVLRWDLRDTVERTWLSQTDGVPTLDQDVTVEEPTSDLLGLERFYQYSGTAAGAGSNLLVNQFAGNAVFSYDAFSNPSRGLATFVRLTYNSQDASDSRAGFGWSVSASALTRLGSPLQFHPPGQAKGGFPDRVTLIDGDGTGHLFDLDRHGSSDRDDWSYESPAGVHVFLQRDDDAPASRRWVMTSPDRTRMFFDEQGYQTAMADRNGNELLFGYQPAEVGSRHVQLLREITDATGRRTLSLDYYQRGESFSFFSDNIKRAGTGLSNEAITDQLKSITDISGRTITFVYSDRGLLQEVVDGAGTAAAKPFTFFYTDTKVNQDTRLARVVDPNGNASTLTYLTDRSDHLRYGHVQVLTDRRGGATGFDYADADGDAGSVIASRVTDANGNTATGLIDGFGRPEQVTNAKGETTRLAWDADNNVVSLTEDNGALTTWVYDQNTGYPLEMRDAEANAHGHPAATFGYRTDLDGHVADLTERVSPEGRRWSFTYDDRGNLVAVTDPKGTASAADGDFTTRHTYDEFGHLATSTDANGNTTTYADYDPNGFPQRITDPLGCSGLFGYDAVGNVLSTRDAAGSVRTFTYDVFKRPLSSRVPKDGAAGQFIVTPGPVYDRNDNVVRLTDAAGSVTTMAYDEADQHVAVTAPKDTPDGPAKTTTFAYDAVGNLIRQTDPEGNLTPANASDFVTGFTYDQVNQLTVVTDALGQRTTAAYDEVGNLVTVVDPRKNATPDPTDVTARFGYDLNHRHVESVDAAGNRTSTRYDRDGNVVGSTDEEGNETVTVLDERAMPVEVRSPHSRDGADVTFFTTRFEYDQVGNLTRTISPRGVATADDPDDFATTVVYDELNRVTEELFPFDSGDDDVPGPDRMTYAYDEVGNLVEVSAPPSDGQRVRNTTRYTYFDNGWTRSQVDPFGITTNYDYNALGQQTTRTTVSAGGSSSRTMTWDYYPDGKLRSRSDDGVPVGRHVVLVDNSDANSTEAAGSWDTAATGTDHEGFDFRTHPPGDGTATFTWRADIPADGTYEVFVRYPAGTATDATYTVEHDGGVHTATVDQTQHVGEWVSLGRFSFTEGNLREVTLSDRANGTVVADAVQLVRDNSTDPDAESKTFTHRYDANDNLVSLLDTSPGAPVDDYAVSYDGLDRVVKVEERDGGVVRNTTTYGYDPDSNLLNWTHDDQSAAFAYDLRDLVEKVTNTRAGDDEAKVTTFTYTARRHLRQQVKHNGNTVDYEYFPDGLLRHLVERRQPSGQVVNEHTLEYNPNGHRTRDTSRIQNADNHDEILDTVRTYDYDPRDRVREVTRTGDGGDTTETYDHDANSNVIAQTVAGTSTVFRYDRNRLVSATAGDVTSAYAYDPFGRLSKVSTAGRQTERYIYDGFDRTAEFRGGSGASAVTTLYTYDPLDRTVRTAVTGGSDPKTTDLHYLGLSEQVLTERVGGEVGKSYQYSPLGELLSQVVVTDGGEQESSYYGYNPHSDVENITDEDGNNRATYGYTAYGQNDTAAFTGVDTPDADDTAAEPYNNYRFNTKRVDAASGNYDMGFRDYAPSQNRFLSLDLYNGALADLHLATNPFTMNRYAFGGGNPISSIELDGHWPSLSDIGHAALDVAGLVPVVGEAADLANAAWYAAEGDWTNAALSAASAIPFAGYAASAVKGGKYALKGADAVQAGVKSGDEVAAGVRGTDDAAEAVDAGTSGTRAAPTPAKAEPVPAKAEQPPVAPKNDAPSCPVNSFVPGTAVLMADGTYKPIENVEIGDRVLATDPVTGTTKAQPVTALITGLGTKNLVRITVDTDDPRGDDTDTVTATDGHPFWVPDLNEWVDAADLRPGDWLVTPDDQMLQVTGIRTWTSYLRVHNLTVAGLHTYYVLADNHPLLVHNDSCGDLLDEARVAARAAPSDATMTAAARIKNDPDSVEIGYSGGQSRIPINEGIDLSRGGQTFKGDAGNCAEIRACSLVLRNNPGATLSDIEFIVVRTATGGIEPSCLSCVATLLTRGATDLGGI